MLRKSNQRELFGSVYKLHTHTLLERWGRAFGKSYWSSNSKYLRTGAKFHAVENYAPVHGRGLIPQDLEIWSVSFNPKGRLLNRIWDNLGSRGEVPCGMKKEGRKSERAKERFMESQPKCLNLELKPAVVVHARSPTTRWRQRHQPFKGSLDYKKKKTPKRSPDQSWLHETLSAGYTFELRINSL